MRASGIVLGLALLALAGCGGFGELASSPKTFQSEDLVTVAPTTPDRFFAAATDAGKALGFSLAGMNRPKNQIAFNRAASDFAMVMVGTMEDVTVQLELRPDDKTIAIDISAMGNFDAASPEAVSKVIEQFKSALSARLGA